MALVALDVESVEKINSTRFVPEVSNTLVKYLGALPGAIKHFNDKNEAAEAELSKLSTKDLKKKAQKLLDELK